MAIALVANAIAQGLGGATTGAIDTTGATLLVLVSASVDSVTPTDSKSNTWSNLTSRNSSGVRVRIHYAANPTVGSGHTFSYGGTATTLAVAAFSGAVTTSPFDQENGATDTTASALATGSVTPSEDNELLVAGIGYDNSRDVSSIDLSFTITNSLPHVGGTAYGGGLAYLIQTTATARNPTWTLTGATSSGIAAAIATFKAAAGGGSSVSLLMQHYN